MVKLPRQFEHGIKIKLNCLFIEFKNQFCMIPTLDIIFDNVFKAMAKLLSLTSDFGD